MKHLIIYSIILIFSINAYSQQFTLPEFIREYSDLYSFYTETENGVLVYKWKKDKKKVSERIRLGCGFDEDIIYHGHSGGGLFVNGLRHGKWILRSCDSGVKQEINYNKGLVTGHYKVYVTLITIKSEYAGEIINTFRDREKVHYRDTILYETNFGDGDGNGEWKSFWGYTKGFAIRETGYYKNGKKSGEWCYYTAKGNFLYRKEYYENGVLIRYEDFEIPDEYNEFVD